MQIPLDITFRDISVSPALVTEIEAWARKLDTAFSIQRCAVIIEKPHKRRRHGSEFQIHLTITIPGHEVTVSRGDRQPDPYLAVTDAFRAARRQLIDFTTQRREARPEV
jgi:ribosome-associated translation inhibitor RaiA